MDYELRQMHIKREKAKARILRKSGWWQAKLARAQCHYCSKALAAADVTMDHLLPLSRGGYSTKGNIVCACKACNTAKQDQLPIDWLNPLANEIAALENRAAGTEPENH